MRTGHVRVLDVLRSSEFAAAYTSATIGALFATHALRQLMGDAGLGAVTTTLCVIGAGMLVARRRELRVVEIMPTTLGLLLVWLLASFFWGPSASQTFAGWLQLAVPTFLAVVVAQLRDTLQTVRSTGDVLRFLLAVSLGLEILSGILLDGPIRFLGIGGNLALGGPIQGIFGTRTVLGVVTMIALITFLVEWRTRSVAPGISLFSVVLAAVLAVFTDSPIVLMMAVVTVLATLILALLRRAPAPARPAFQRVIGGAVALGLVLAYVFRRPLVYWLNAEPDFLVRSRLWNAAIDLSESRPVQGWGWVGTWPDYLSPYSYIRLITGRDHGSALNAWVDMLLQAGGVGVALLALLAGFALARSWMSATERRSTVYTWTPLVLIILLADSVVTSALLGGFGWFLLVVCSVSASKVRGWRRDLSERVGG